MKVDKDCLVRMVVDSVSDELKTIGRVLGREEIEAEIRTAFRELNKRFAVGITNEEIDISTRILTVVFWKG